MLKQIFMAAALATAAIPGYAQLTWTTSTQAMPVPLQMHGAAVLNGYLYAIAGNSNTTTPPYGAAGDSPYMYYAPITSPGVTGAWTTCTAVLPNGVTPTEPDFAYINRHVSSYNGRIYVTGGNTNGPDTERDSILILTPEANGDILTTGAVIEPTLGASIARFEHTSIIDPATGKLYVLGGGPSDIAQVAQIDPVTGAVGPFSTFGTLAYTIYEAPAVILNNRLYLIGGLSGSAKTTTQYADLSSTAPVAFSTATGLLPEARFDGSAQVIGGNIYLFGGALAGNASIRKSTFKATVDSVTGDLTAWTADTDIPVGDAKPGDRRETSATDGTAIYIPGGRIDATTEPVLSDVVYIARDLSRVEDFLLY